MLNHEKIISRLKELGFFQPVPSKNGCWINESIVIYYISKPPEYTICKGEGRNFFKTVNELNLIYERLNNHSVKE